MKPLVIYHANCMDGAAAALAAWLKFGDDAEYRPADYGDPAPTDEEVRGRDVYVLDFSYPRARLERWWESCKSWACEQGWPDSGVAMPKLIVLDHHKTAQVDLEGVRGCTFDMTKSGGALAWEHFHVRKREERQTYVLPELFAYVQDRDLWRWELPHSREVSAALAASGALVDFRKLIPIYEGWDGLMANETLAQEGAAILRAERLMVERVAATAEEVEIRFESHEEPERPMNWVAREIRALAVSCPLLQSEVGEALALESARRGRDAVGVVYYRDGEKGKWRVSLRSRDVEETDEQLKARALRLSRYVGPIDKIKTSAPDVSAIAKSHGGGGHARAAGFECGELPWARR